MNRFLMLVPAVGLTLGLALPAAAQQPPARQAVPVAPAAAPAPTVVYQTDSSASDVQRQLQQLLEQYPPSLREVLQIDPTLIDRPDYLAPYPMLMAFLQQHPEIARNPSFFFGSRGFRQRDDRERSLDFLEGLAGGSAVLVGFIVIVSLIYSLLRQALDYRRWRRQVQIQTDVHNKVFDRLTTNQEILAYLDTPVARRFLESSPAAPAEAPLMAPVARIIWSVQIGVVVAAIGAGFWLARGTVDDLDVSRGFQVLGTIAAAVGVGFIISAVVAWLLSQRMGLLRGLRAES
jgi:hypothetical protein